jgi:Fe-S cluster biogenesis protein NfuA/nitrite reductase/ring-hydroxylating ferredoxin subunit
VDDAAARDLVGRVEALLDEVESQPAAIEAVQALVELYGEGLARIVAGLADPLPLADDELVAHLLLLHDLHPVPLEERVLGALDEVRPYLESHKGGVELVAIDEGVVRLRLQGSCSGCPSSTMTLKLAIEDAINKAAPDIDTIEAEGVAEPAPAPGPTLLQIDPSPLQAWTTAGSLAELSGGGALVKQVGGEPLLFVRLEDDSFAYRPTCPSCGAELDSASLHGAELRCPGCRSNFDVRRAGRCLDEPQLQLKPVPLLAGESGIVKVAMA